MQQGEAVRGGQLAQAILEGVARLHDALAAHAAGGVQDEHHVAGHLLGLGQLGPRREQQHDVAVASGHRPVRQGGQADVLAAGGVEELEVLVQDGLVPVEADDRLAVAGPGDGDGVCRAIDILQGVLRLEGDGQGELLQGADGLGVGAQRVDVLDQADLGLGHRGVANGDLLVAARGDGEDAQLEQAVVHVFQETGILGLLDDVGVDLAGLGGLDEFARDLFAGDPHGELADGGALGDGEDVGGLELAVGVVAEGLLDAGDGDLVVDGDGDLVVEQGQGREFLFGRDEQAAGLARPGGEQHQQHGSQRASHRDSPFLLEPGGVLVR